MAGLTHLREIVKEIMKMEGVYSVHDAKSNTWLRPFISKTNATAIRDFETAVNQGEGMIAQYPGDFTLFKIGTWDELTGNIEPDEHKTDLGLAISYKREPNEKRALEAFMEKQREMQYAQENPESRIHETMMKGGKA